LTDAYNFDKMQWFYSVYVCNFCICIS